MIVFNKDEIREKLETEDIFQLLGDWGGEPERTSFGIVSTTICHNPPGEGSRKLYYYINSKLFICYTGGCEKDKFDIFDLVIKIANIQWNKEYNLNDAVMWIANFFGFSGTFKDETVTLLEDWKYFRDKSKDKALAPEILIPQKTFDENILSRFDYKTLILPWLKENISIEAMKKNYIGYYPGDFQISIPHFDKDGKLIGIRGRALSIEEAEQYGKYRPLRIDGILYNHPLGMHLYNFNFSKENIKNFGTAIVFESEKSCLQYKTYFGEENDISTACCGSSFTAQQMQLLKNNGAKEIIIAMDRQFKELNDSEHLKLVKKFYKLQERYGNSVKLSFIFDKDLITDYKDSPTDKGKDIFLKLFSERVFI